GVAGPVWRARKRVGSAKAAAAQDRRLIALVERGIAAVVVKALTGIGRAPASFGPPPRLAPLRARPALGVSVGEQQSHYCDTEQNKTDRAHGSFVGWLCDCSRYWDYCRARGVGSKKTRQKSRSKWPKPATTRLHPGRTLVGPRPPRPAYCSGRFPRLAPPHKISIALMWCASSYYGLSMNVNESFPLIAAALDEDLRLEIDAPAFDIVRYVIAVLFGVPTELLPICGCRRAGAQRSQFPALRHLRSQRSRESFASSQVHSADCGDHDGAALSAFGAWFQKKAPAEAGPGPMLAAH